LGVGLTREAPARGPFRFWAPWARPPHRNTREFAADVTAKPEKTPGPKISAPVRARAETPPHGAGAPNPSAGVECPAVGSSPSVESQVMGITVEVQAQGLPNLAGSDVAFARVPGLTRYAAA